MMIQLLKILKEELEHDDTTIKNIERCKKILDENKKEEKIFEKALDDFEQESIYIINKLSLFYYNADENSNIICTHKNLASLLKCSPSKAQELLEKFIEKKYILKIKSHDYETSASVYKINNFINKKITELENNELLTSSFIDNLDNFTINNLKGLDYIKIKEKLYKIEKEEYKEIFIRDYNELVFNYLSNQYKTTVLLSGTIVELLLLYILENNNIKKYAVGSKPKEKKIQEMDITDMLKVCEKEDILHKTPQRFIDGVKNFRNFIHPGKELREKLLSINKQTVDLSMDIVRWLILETEL